MTLGFCDCNQGRLPCTCRPDWSTAPDGATHWGSATVDYHASWYRYQHDRWSGITVEGHREFKDQCTWYDYGSRMHRDDLEARL